MKKYLTPNQKRIFHLIIYVAFLFYSISFIIQATTFSSQLFYTLITIVFLSIALFAEYLEHLYESAIKALNYECDPEKAKELMNQLQAIDFLNAYKKRRILFDLLYHLALLNSNEAIHHIHMHDTFFRSTPDSLFIRNTSLFIAYVQSNQKSQAKKAWAKVITFKSASYQKRKGAALYNWDELEGLYHFISNHPEKACRSYKNVNPIYMNNKEKSQFYFFYYQAAVKCHMDSLSHELLEKLMEIKRKIPYEKRLEEISHESAL